MGKKSIAGLVVTYNPSLEQIKNIISTAALVDSLYVFDNSCDYLIKRKLKEYLSFSKIKIFFNKKNYGIGKSANFFFKKIKNNFNWCLLLDQDSKINVNLKVVTGFLDQKNICIAGLNFSEKLTLMNNYDFFELRTVRRIIFSGSIVNKKIFSKYLFKENLFLDMTDFSFCEILNRNNIKIWKIMNIYFEHHIGQLDHNSFLSFVMKRTNHPPINCFLMARNRIILLRENLYKSSLFKILLRQFKEILYTFIFEDNKKAKIFARIKGVWHGLVDSKFDSIDDIKKIL